MSNVCRSVLVLIFLAFDYGEAVVKCLKGTDGTCMVDKCHDWRDAKCRGGKCECGSGMCAGMDGACYNGNYEILDGMDENYPGETGPLKNFPGTYEIFNSRWVSYYMYMGMMGGLSVSEDHDEGASKWKIAIAHNPERTGAKIFLYNKEYSHMAVAVREEEVEYDGDYTTEWRPRGVKVTQYTEPREVGLEIMLAPEDAKEPKLATLVMINSLWFETKYLHVSQGSWAVTSWEYDGGAGTYWYIKPPLPDHVIDMMKRYSGPRCKAMCGKTALASSAQLSSVPWITAAFVMLSALRSALPVIS